VVDLLLPIDTDPSATTLRWPRGVDHRPSPEGTTRGDTRPRHSYADQVAEDGS
jgi:hypothetical protein